MAGRQLTTTTPGLPRRLWASEEWQLHDATDYLCEQLVKYWRTAPQLPFLCFAEKKSKSEEGSGSETDPNLESEVSSLFNPC